MNAPLRSNERERLGALLDAFARVIKVNCAALPTGLIESELFGHEKGAFTGAASVASNS